MAIGFSPAVATNLPAGGHQISPLVAICRELRIPYAGLRLTNPMPTESIISGDKPLTEPAQRANRDAARIRRRHRSGRRSDRLRARIRAGAERARRGPSCGRVAVVARRVPIAWETDRPRAALT